MDLMLHLVAEDEMRKNQEQRREFAPLEMLLMRGIQRIKDQRCGSYTIHRSTRARA